MKRPLRTHTNMQIMQVADRYFLDDGIVELDLIDRQGRVYSGCTLCSMGNNQTEFSIVPDIDSEVLVVVNAYQSPYVIGSIADAQQYKTATIDANGEHSEGVNLSDVQIKNGSTRLILTDNSMFQIANVRIQGDLKISNGGQADRPLALANELQSQINTYQVAINSLINELLELSLLVQTAGILPPTYVPPVISTVAQIDDTIKTALIHTES